MRLKLPPKLFKAEVWLSQFDRQTVPCSRSSHSETTIAERRVSPHDREQWCADQSTVASLLGNVNQILFMSFAIVRSRCKVQKLTI